MPTFAAMIERRGRAMEGASSRKSRWSLAVATLAIAAGALVPLAARALTSTGATTRVNLSSSGQQAAGGRPISIQGLAPSADGRYVAFASSADTLVPGDTNQDDDVFVFDRVARTTARVSVKGDGSQADGSSYNPSISGDGRYVAFQSNARLVPGATYAIGTYVRDLQAGTTTLVTPPSATLHWDYTEYPAMSADGRYVGFVSEESGLVPGDTNDDADVFVRDLATGLITRVNISSTGAEASPSSMRSLWLGPALSGDGRYVAFLSRAPNLVPGDTNGKVDVFVRDLVAHTTSRVNVTSDGGQSVSDDAFFSSLKGLGLSADGRYLTFSSSAPDLVPGDTNGDDPEDSDVFVRDLVAGVTTRVSVATDGSQGGLSVFGSYRPSISADGQLVAFVSGTAGLVPGDGPDADLFVHNRATGVTELVSTAAGGRLVATGISSARISADGNVVAFSDDADNLLPDDTNRDPDAFAYDRRTGTIERINVSTDGRQPNRFAGSFSPAMSADGRYVAFSSEADNLVPGDTNNRSDVFVRDRVLGTTLRASVASDGSEADDFGSNYTIGSVTPAISADGRWVAFASRAADLVPGDLNGAVDVFVHDRVAGGTELVSASGGGGGAEAPAISADGRFVAFQTRDRLIPADGNGQIDVYVRDRRTGGLVMASVASDGSLPAAADPDGSTNGAISADGQVVAFESDAALVPGLGIGQGRIYVHDFVAGTTRLASGPSSTASSARPALSADGRFVAFDTTAPELAPPGASGRQVYVRDLVSGALALVSVGSDGTPGRDGNYDDDGSFAPAVSDDGRYVAFVSAAEGLDPKDPIFAHYYVRDVATGTTTRVSGTLGPRYGFGTQTGIYPSSARLAPAISADGALVAFTSESTDLVVGDTNAVHDIFVHAVAEPPPPPTSTTSTTTSSTSTSTTSTTTPAVATATSLAREGDTLAATVIGPAPAITGQVRFVVDGTPAATAAVGSGGRATMPVAGLTPGSRSVVAQYLGTATHAPSSSAALVVQVASVGSRFTPLTPARILDTRTGNGAAAAPLPAKGVVELQVTGRGAVPADATAVVLNVTSVAMTGAPSSYLTAWPTGASRPVASNLNYRAGDVVPNLVTVKLGAGGKVSLYNDAGTVHVLADVAGYYATSAASSFTALQPARILDTRTGNGAPPGTVGPNGVVELQVTGRGGVPANASGVVLNVTGVGLSGSPRTFITAYPTGSALPATSNLNLASGQTVPNLVAAKIGAGGKVSLYNNAGRIHLVADIAGYYGATGSTFTPVEPQRLLDTRAGIGAPARRVAAGGTVELQVSGRGGVSDDSTAVILNVTAVNLAGSATSYLTAWPTGQPMPLTSNLNMVTGQVVPNLVVAKVGSGGKVSIANRSGTIDIVADIAGYFRGS